MVPTDRPRRVYLDHAATAPMPPAVRDAYVAALGIVGNPASIHGHGQDARELLEQGRERVAASLGADPVEVILTSGGTESVNLGIKGLYWSRNATGTRPRVIVPRGEHHATIDSVEWLERHEGARLDWIDLDEVGRIRLDQLARALADPSDAALVTSLWASNEVGTIQPVAEIVRLAAAAGVPVHLDAVAAYGAVPIDAHAVGAAAVSVSAHKIGGPVGVGALVLARNAAVEPLLHGGAQQRARSGTQDAAGAVAFGVAAEAVVADLPRTAAHLAAIRDRLADGIRGIPGATLRGDWSPGGRLPGSVHATFDDCDGDALLYLLDVAGFSVSTGSACQAGVAEPSHVLLAMGLPEAAARSALRFTLGRDTTADDIDALLEVLPDVVDRARATARALRG